MTVAVELRQQLAAELGLPWLEPRVPEVVAGAQHDITAENPPGAQHSRRCRKLEGEEAHEMAEPQDPETSVEAPAEPESSQAEAL